MGKKFAIFDMDGTLVDSMALWRNLGREYLTAKGVTENLEDVLREVHHLNMNESATLFVERFALGVSPQKAAAEMTAIMDGHYREDVPLKPGAAKHLEQLRQAGVRMCVASVTPGHLIEACLRRLGVRDYFAFALSCNDMGTSKRDPNIYLEAAGRLGAPPAEVAVYEDALYAAQTAKGAGFYVVGVQDSESAHHWEEICRLADETISFD